MSQSCDCHKECKNSKKEVDTVFIVGVVMCCILSFILAYFILS